MYYNGQVIHITYIFAPIFVIKPNLFSKSILICNYLYLNPIYFLDHRYVYHISIVHTDTLVYLNNTKVLYKLIGSVDCRALSLNHNDRRRVLHFIRNGFLIVVLSIY